jgi:hypothetical protein
VRLEFGSRQKRSSPRLNLPCSISIAPLHVFFLSFSTFMMGKYNLFLFQVLPSGTMYAIIPVINNLGLRYTFVLIAGLSEVV